jgi:hypothetical protein
MRKLYYFTNKILYLYHLVFCQHMVIWGWVKTIQNLLNYHMTEGITSINPSYFRVPFGSRGLTHNHIEMWVLRLRNRKNV